MVWNYNDGSSESEEERHDKFRSERTVATKVGVDIKEKFSSISHFRSPDRSDRHRDKHRSERRHKSPHGRLKSVKDGPYDRKRSSSERNNKSSYTELSSNRYDTSERKDRSSKSRHSDSKRHSKKSHRSSDDSSSKESRTLVNGNKEYLSSSKRSSEIEEKSRKKHKQICKSLVDDISLSQRSCKQKEVSIHREKGEKSPVSNDIIHFSKDLITVDTYSGNNSENEKDASSVNSKNLVFGPALPPKNTEQPPPKMKEKKVKKCKRKALKKLNESSNKSLKIAPEVDRSEINKLSSEGHEEKKDKQKPESELELSPQGESNRQVHGPKEPGKEDLEEGEVEDEDTGSYGPSLPPGMKNTQVEEDIGPVPQGVPLTPAQLALHHRAALLRLHMDNKVQEKEELKREEWMLELPEKNRVGLGLVSRSFRSKEGPVQDSSWTDTPEEKARKEALGEVGVKEKTSEEQHKALCLQERDKEMEKLAQKANKEKKRSSKSLLEMHQEKRKKKEKKEKDKEERKPFSRDDLKVNVLSDSQKKEIYKRAQHLDSRFSCGESKYL